MEVAYIGITSKKYEKYHIKYEKVQYEIWKYEKIWKVT